MAILGCLPEGSDMQESGDLSNLCIELIFICSLLKNADSLFYALNMRRENEGSYIY